MKAGVHCDPLQWCHMGSWQACAGQFKQCEGEMVMK